MATPYQKVYDAFSSMILEDEWSSWSDEMVEADMRMILENATIHFKFPRIPLDRDDNGFSNQLGYQEIIILANYMKLEWLNRTLLSYKNLKSLYSEQDFSQANMIDKLTKLLSETNKNIQELESTYYRSVNGRPYSFYKMAGG